MLAWTHLGLTFPCNRKVLTACNQNLGLSAQCYDFCAGTSGQQPGYAEVMQELLKQAEMQAHKPARTLVWLQAIKPVFVVRRWLWRVAHAHVLLAGLCTVKAAYLQMKSLVVADQKAVLCIMSCTLLHGLQHDDWSTWSLAHQKLLRLSYIKSIDTLY